MMTIRTFVALAALFFALPGMSQVWKQHHSFEGKFSILAPDTMLTRTDTIKTPLGNLAQHITFYQDQQPEGENKVYMVTWFDYPAGVMHHDSTELVQALFDETVEAAAFSVAGNVRWSTDISYGLYPGRMWRVDYKDGRGVIKTKALFVRNRYYAIQVVTRKERALNYDADKFIDSFRLMAQER
jgi:hypothetical protein